MKNLTAVIISVISLKDLSVLYFIEFQPNDFKYESMDPGERVKEKERKSNVKRDRS